MKTHQKKQWLFGLPFVVGDIDALVQRVLEQYLDTGKFQLLRIFTPNPEQVMLAQRRLGFYAVLRQVEWLVPDGIGLVWADRLLSWRLTREWRLRQRVAGVDLMEKLSHHALKRGKNVFFLGGRGSVAAEAAATMQQRFENVGVGDGQGEVFGVPGPLLVRDASPGEWREVWEQLERVQPAVLFVGFGAPIQEQWVVAQSKRLQECGVRVVMVVGGAFDMLAGEVSRAPVIWRKGGLEWLWRLLQQPWRLGRQLWLLAFGVMVGWQVLVGAEQRTS